MLAIPTNPTEERLKRSGRAIAVEVRGRRSRSEWMRRFQAGRSGDRNWGEERGDRLLWWVRLAMGQAGGAIGVK